MKGNHCDVKSISIELIYCVYIIVARLDKYLLYIPINVLLFTGFAYTIKVK